MLGGLILLSTVGGEDSNNWLVLKICSTVKESTTVSERNEVQDCWNDPARDLHKKLGWYAH